MWKTLVRYKEYLGTFRAFCIQYRKWRCLLPSIIPCADPKERLVIIPCDPGAVGGSRGDEAMIMAVIQRFREKYAQAPVTVVSRDEVGDNYIKELPIEGVTPLTVWNGNYPLERIYCSVIEQRPSLVVVLGADCMDGFYSPIISLTLLGLHDLFSRTPGIESRLLGFSFNARPYRPICRAFDNLSKSTRICIRDPVSRERFLEKTHVDAEIVADAAFMLRPDYDFKGYKDLEEWIATRRKAGTKHFIGMNFHPMLRKYTCQEEITKDAIRLACNVEILLLDDKTTDFVLIPHDDRNGLTDNLMLGTISEYLRERGLVSRFYYHSEVYRASQIKALCRLLDGLVSSRMHLAIAALGQGKSVLAASYQGKFEGLFQHFNLSGDYLLSPEVFVSESFVQAFRNYISHLAELTLQVEARLPGVLALSEKNML